MKKERKETKELKSEREKSEDETKRFSLSRMTGVLEAKSLSTRYVTLFPYNKEVLSSKL